MASIEGMYALIAGTEASAGGGVVVLETGRIFGGDSAMAYKGEYTASSAGASGTVHTWQYIPDAPGVDVITVFNIPGNIPMDIEFSVNWTDDEHLRGQVWPIGHKEMALPIVLRRISDLP